MRAHSIAIGALLAMTGACASEQQPPPEYPLLEEPEPEAEVEAEQVPEPEPEAMEPPPPPVRVVAGERTPLEDDPPSLRIVQPKEGQNVRREHVQVRVRVDNWPLKPEPGKHLHLILDNEPYIAIRDVEQPLNLNELAEAHLGTELSTGTHLIRMFPSRHMHESVKEQRPFDMVVFHYGEKSEDWDFDPDAPLLTYSRPKGCNPAGERILLDFYLTNVEELSGEGLQVRYTIGDVTGLITDWTPHFIENLPEGEHEVRLQLVDAEGELVEGPFNDTTRTIQVGDCNGEDDATQDDDEGAEDQG